ncbi:MAG: FprA family A-type flavoprotein [Clostridia bacterium]
MKETKATDNIWYVGIQDKDIRTFDIIMHTDYGTSYNSYILKDGDITVLFETNKLKFWDEYIANIKAVCDPQSINYIVLNHTEPDHSGCLAKLLELAPNAIVVGSNAAITFAKQIANADFTAKTVNDGDEICLATKTMQFIMTPMLHWPDTMFTYIKEDKALFTCDSFGCHYAGDNIFNDLISGDFYDAYKYYFDNIIGPYKNPFMKNALKKIENLEIEFIGNGHGPVIRKNVQYYIDLYKKWCETPKADEKKVVIAYVSAYGYTKSLAMAIANGICSYSDKISAEVVEIESSNKEEIKAKIAAADGFLLGSPTLVGDALPPVYEMLIGLNPIIHKGKFAGAFGSFGWSGEAVPNLISRLTQLKMNIPLDGLKVQLKPSKDDFETAKQYGSNFAKAILN